MSGQNKKQRSRTYARNRTKLSRRGFDKHPEPDSVFLLKLVGVAISASIWLKFTSQLTIFGVIFGGLPIGAIISIATVYFFEKRQMNRHIFYAIIFIVAILSYFLPLGIIL
ncbi:MAG: hypothetical protein KIG14_01735 [Candidatus Sacchiramonaceae bacterium]|nr:hypothetical protein [Candidatus Saccharimonadaceae bacterium]